MTPARMRGSCQARVAAPKDNAVVHADLADGNRHFLLRARTADLEIAYLACGEPERHKDAISRCGAGLKAIKAIAWALP